MSDDRKASRDREPSLFAKRWDRSIPWWSRRLIEFRAEAKSHLLAGASLEQAAERAGATLGKESPDDDRAVRISAWRDGGAIGWGLSARITSSQFYDFVIYAEEVDWGVVH